MAKHKWYVVVVGRDIGVFQTWVEVGPLVRGVSGAVHQSFPTEAEARHAFAQAEAKGHTRIIDDYHKDVTFFSPPSDAPQTPKRSASTIDSPRTTPRLSKGAVVLSPPSSNMHHPSSPVRPVARSSSEPSAKARRYEIIKALFDEEQERDVGVAARASSGQYARTATPKTRDSSLESPASARVIVKTPAWLPSYPKIHATPEPLSPLSHADIPLSNFGDDGSRRGLSPYQPAASSPRVGSGTLNRSPTVQSECDSSIVLSPSARRVHVVHDYVVDPRSPMMNMVPEPTILSSISFARPSPKWSPREIQSHGADKKSSLLFSPNIPRERIASTIS